MIMYGQQEMNGKEAVMVFFKLLSQHSPGEIEKNNKTP
jgi:hypothetical protein